MLELAMAATGSDDDPAVQFEQLEGVANLWHWSRIGTDTYRGLILDGE